MSIYFGISAIHPPSSAAWMCRIEMKISVGEPEAGFFSRNPGIIDMDTNAFDFNSVAGRLSEVEEKQKALDAERAALRADVLAQCRKYAEMFKFTAKELGIAYEAAVAQPKRVRSAAPMKPKYKNPDGEETWSGRGARKPEWFQKAIDAGFSPQDILIEQQ